MTKKIHNRILQTNPQHGTRTVTSHQEDTYSKSTSFLFLGKMIAKLERTISTA